MKASLTAALSALVLVSAVLTNRASAQASTLTAPVGWLTASPGMVKLGTTPTLNWEISNPSSVIDHVEVIPPGIVETKEALDYKIRVLGAGVTSSYADGSNMSFVHTEAYFSVNGGSYERIFAGTNDDVNPGKVVASGTSPANRKFRFGGRFYFNKAWSTFYSSNNGTQNVRTLVNGDYPPTTYTLATAPSLEDFIKPYLDGAGRVSIGPMDVIVFMELTHTDAQNDHQGYDCQDMVLLVTFESNKGKK